MKLTISAKGVLDYCHHDIKDEEINPEFIKERIEWFIKVRKVKRVTFKLEGEAEERKIVQMACLFG